MAEQLLPGYCIRLGSTLDRALLVKFMQWTYQDMFPTQDFSHLTRTVEQYFSKETPLWWVEEEEGTRGIGHRARGIGQGASGKGHRARGIGQGASGKGHRASGIGQAASGIVKTTNSQFPIPNAQFPMPNAPIACLWMGNAIDQVTGDRHAHIFLLYVVPEYRRRGIGTALMQYAENWALKRGDRQIGLQVFQSNQPALNLYNQLGYNTQSLWMVKSLHPEK